MKAARARGVRPGPKPKLSRQQIDPARKLIDNGHRREDVADLFKVGALHKPKTRVRGRWSNNVYHLQTISALKIFDKVENSTVSGFPDKAPRHSTVSASTDTVMTDTVGTDTNQMQRLTRRLNVNDLEKAALKRGERQQTVSDSEFQAALERRMLITDILNVCGDQHSRGFYNMVVQKVPAELVRAALSETKYRGSGRPNKKIQGSFFHRRD